MTQTARNRFAIDLDEIERQLSSQPSASKHDPLSELARVVGQDDPFRSILKSPAPPARAVQDPAYDDLFVPREAPRGQAPQPQYDFEAELAASLRAPAQVQSVPAYEPQAYAQPHAYQPAPADWEADYGEQVRDLQPSARRGRKGLLAVAAVLGVAALGVGSALVLGVGRPGAISGEPPLITAQPGPLKVQPENPGGVEIPNQNKQIYERAATEQKTKVVNREEQPLDVAQATRPGPRVALPQPADASGGRAAPLVPPAPAGVAPAPAPAAAAIPALGEPRRVRTVSVRPDGTLVASDGAPVPAPPARPVAAAPSPAPAPAAPPMQIRTAGAGPVAPVTTASAPPRAAAPAPAPAAPPAPRIVETPRPAAAAPVVKEQQRLAALPPTPTTAAPAPAPAAEAAPAARAGSGTWVVQLGVSGSEAAARTAFEGFRSRYGAALGGAGPVITQAEVNGKTIFRVRAGPMGRDEAEETCTKVKAAGGACFFARN